MYKLLLDFIGREGVRMQSLRQENARGSTPGEIWAIQYLRALAAIAVVVFHQLGAYGIFILGRHGVDLFFVISGFIMVALTEHRPVTPRQFILDRIARIVPPYWVATTIVFLLALLHIQMFDASRSLIQFAKSLMFVPSYNETGEIWPTLYLGWTLNYEMIFYVVFAIGLFLPGRMRPLFLSAVFIPAVLIGMRTTTNDAVFLTYTNYRVVEFVAGAWIGVTFGVGLDKTSLVWAALYSFLNAACLAVAALWMPDLVFGAIAVFTLATFLIIEKAALLPKVWIFKAAGDASFAIYLFQGLAFLITDTLSRGIDQLFGLDFDAHGVIRLFRIAAAIGLGYVVFITVEKPLTRFARRLLRHITAEPAAIRGVTEPSV